MKEHYLAGRTADGDYSFTEAFVALAERRLISHSTVCRAIDADVSGLFNESTKEHLHALFADPSRLRQDNNGEQLPLPTPPLFRKESDFNHKFLDGGLVLIGCEGEAAEVAVHNKVSTQVFVHEANETPAPLPGKLTGSIWGTEQSLHVRDPRLLGADILKLLATYDNSSEKRRAMYMLKHKVAWAAISLSAFDLTFQEYPEKLAAAAQYTNMPSDFIGTVIRFHRNKKVAKDSRLRIA